MDKDLHGYIRLLHTMLASIGGPELDVEVDRVPVSKTPYVVASMESFDALVSVRNKFVDELLKRGFEHSPKGGVLIRNSERGSFFLERPRIFCGTCNQPTMRVDIDGPYAVLQDFHDPVFNEDDERESFESTLAGIMKFSEDIASCNASSFASTFSHGSHQVKPEDIAYSGGKKNRASDAFFAEVREALEAASNGRITANVETLEHFPEKRLRARMNADFDDFVAVRRRFCDEMVSRGFVPGEDGYMTKTGGAGTLYLSIGCIAASQQGDAFLDVEPFGPTREEIKLSGRRRPEHLEKISFESRRRRFPIPEEGISSPPGP
jgi:hypothetical protein